MRFVRGAVLFSELIRTDVSASNVGIVTLTAPGADVISVDLGTVVANDLVIATFFVSGTKGVTAGLLSYAIDKGAGTATIQFSGAFNLAEMKQDNITASATSVTSYTQIFKVTVGGTLTLRLSGKSGGSDFTIPGAAGALRGIVIRGTA